MPKKSFLTNYIYNTLYQVLVLFAPLITTPYVSRVLGVTNIGIYQYSHSIASYFVMVGAVGTTLYGQREIAYQVDDPVERSKAFWEIEFFRIIAVSLCTFVYVIAFYYHGSYPEMYRILTLEVVATAFDITWLFMGMENFRLTVIRNAIIRVIGIVCVFLFVKTSEDLVIYALCVTAPTIIGNFSLWLSVKKYLVKVKFSLWELASGIKKRLKPIFILFLPQIAMEVYLVLDKTMIGLLSSSIDQVGYYAQAQKLIQMILRIVTSLGTVMLPTMSSAFARGQYDRIGDSIQKSFRFTYMLSFALMFGVCAISPRFVPFFYGPGYDPVIGLIIIISPILVIIATSNVLGKQYLLPTNQQKEFTVSILMGAATNFILNCLLIPRLNAVGASIATVFAELAVTFTQCMYTRKQVQLNKCLTSGIRYAIYAAIMFFVCRLVGQALPSGKVWALAVIIIVGAVTYLGLLLITGDQMCKIGIQMIRREKRI